MSSPSSLCSLTCVVSLAACVADGDTDAPPTGNVRLDSDEVGVSLVVPAGYQIDDDPVLFATHGFLVRSTADAEDVVARVAHAWQAAPGDIESLVAAKLALYADQHPTRVDLVLPDGRPAVAVTGLPGTRPYTVVYTSDGDRVYEIGLWSDVAGLADDQRALLGTLAFRAPTPVRRPTLRHAEDALYDEPPAELAAALAADELAHAQAFEVAAAAEPGLRDAASAETVEPPVADELRSCSFTAPATLYWQLQWDRSNRFYSGAVYDLRNEPGWSAMSGNGGSWWGTNYHVGKCYGLRNNQFYANDWPTQNWGNAYAAFGGTIEWAGWGTDGFATLGRYVVVRHGGYRSLTAHLNGIRRAVRWGAHLDGYSQVVGWAGSTGGPWAPHLHARVSWGESLTANGQPYGGQSVRPRRLRCFECGNPDVRATRGGYYTQFFHGRWIKY